MSGRRVACAILPCQPLQIGSWFLWARLVAARSHPRERIALRVVPTAPPVEPRSPGTVLRTVTPLGRMPCTHLLGVYSLPPSMPSWRGRLPFSHMREAEAVPRWRRPSSASPLTLEWALRPPVSAAYAAWVRWTPPQPCLPPLGASTGVRILRGSRTGESSPSRKPIPQGPRHRQSRRRRTSGGSCVRTLVRTLRLSP